MSLKNERSHVNACDACFTSLNPFRLPPPSLFSSITPFVSSTGTNLQYSSTIHLPQQTITMAPANTGPTGNLDWKIAKQVCNAQDIERLACAFLNTEDIHRVRPIIPSLPSQAASFHSMLTQSLLSTTPRPPPRSGDPASRRASSAASGSLRARSRKLRAGAVMGLR